MAELALVTGYPGWLTGHLFRRLDDLSSRPDAPAWVRTLDPLRWRALVAPGVMPAPHARVTEVVEGDIRDADTLGAALEGVSLVLHAAGIIHPRRLGDLYAINRDGTQLVAAAAARHGARRVVFLSSNAAAGFARPGQPMREADPPRPGSHYGRSKWEGEQRFWESLGPSTTGVVLRPTTFYGPYFPERHLRAYRMAASGRPLLIGDGRNSVSMIYIDDLVDTLGAALTREDAAGVTAFVADSTAYQWRDVFVAMGQAQGVDVRPRQLPGAIAPLCALADSVISGLGRYAMMIHVAGEATQHMACDNTVARQRLGVTPTVGLTEGMRRAVAWARAEGWL